MFLYNNIFRNSTHKSFFVFPLHITNDGYNIRTCDFHHGVYDIVSTCGLDFKFVYSNILFEFGLCQHGSFNCP